MFENLTRKQYGGGTIDGARKGAVVTTLEKFLPKKIEAMLKKSSTKAIQGTYRFKDEENTKSVQLESVLGEPLGKINLSWNAGPWLEILEKRTPVKVTERMTSGEEVAISFIGAEKRLPSQAIVGGPSYGTRKSPAWTVGIFILYIP